MVFRHEKVANVGAASAGAVRDVMENADGNHVREPSMGNDAEIVLRGRVICEWSARIEFRIL